MKKSPFYLQFYSYILDRMMLFNTQQKKNIVKKKPPHLEFYYDILDRLMLFSAQRKKNTFLVTSATDLEGKTTTAVNMACALASKGKKTVIVNTDFKKPSNGFFCCETGSFGLADICSAKCSPDNLLVQHVMLPQLWLLHCGVLKQNSLDLFLSEECKSFFNYLKEQFEFIIIDSCSLNKNVDPLILSQYSDGIIFVILSDKTRAGKIAAARDKIINCDCEIVGVVLNNIKKYTYDRL